MKKIDSGKYINYKDYTDTSSATGFVNTSAKPDSLASIIENKTVIYEHPIYPILVTKTEKSESENE